MTCLYCNSPNHDVHEVIYNIMVGYKKAWNHHVAGEACWCRPIHGKGFLFHRNYVFDGTWRAIREPQTA